jgi:multiple sugar transport system ATP-binding protein
MACEIQLDDLRKVYRTGGTEHVAVDGITLDIPEGSFTTLVGPSGCGKTTTLRMLAGLETVTSGRILFGAEDVTDHTPQERDVGMVFQNIALIPHMTVRENIGYVLKLNGVGKERRDEQVEEAAATLRIADQLDKRPADLSGGQQQRVALGSAFVQDPDVLLLDEPMSDIDAKLKAELRVEIQRLHQKLDTTIVYVTHDQTEAMTMSDHVILLNQGRVEQFDPPTNLFDNPVSEYVASFIGTPSTNALECSVETDGETVTLRGHGVTVSIPASDIEHTPEGTATLGIRPQYLSLDAGEYSLQVSVDVVEPIGTESVIHGRTQADAPIDVVTSNVGAIDEESTITVSFDHEDLFIFDQNGETVYLGETQAATV